ncbi:MULTISPECIES: GntR family transcriptional regulator [Bacillus]|uniref:GntR family transcriptional regulator n=1 Tax=Bacillus arachidis TaxID=2819290 RepID=A0ABS3P5J8_9BACI|nr:MULTISPECIES: GntR family transcriptional regulator [Bacillus]MBO1628310.1 GntR family transcriptional regulator [Bacillus arachidis]PEP38743.1 GntR family transcriptional regulator [Bacillus pseudomycoides]PGR98036.1 GntR family transcriptional regulator [Bacillus pseudomycoides]PHC82056.1 GntR family transcriptional regulator [Bacillus pseudomycoides]WIY63114.1 GntR family transcriptional regulator [Bacillus arachidis]
MPIPENYTKQERFSAKTIVLNQLQDWIIKGVLKPDEKINDNDLADALGVSRTPVREALQVLELSGLVEMVRGQKTKISPVKLEDVPVIYETIAGMHVIVGKQAINNIKQKDIKRLKRINENFKHAITMKDSEKAMSLDFEFHNMIVSLANNKYIEPLLDNLHLHALRLEYLFFQNFVPAEHSINEHIDIITALESGDPMLLEHAMSINWLRPMRDIQRILSVM